MIDPEGYRKYIESIRWSEWAATLTSGDIMGNLAQLVSETGLEAAEAAEWFADLILGGTASFNPVGRPLLPVLQGCAGSSHEDAQAVLAKLFVCLLAASSGDGEYSERDLISVLREGVIAMEALAYSRHFYTASLARKLLGMLEPNLFAEFFMETPFNPEEVIEVVVIVQKCRSNGTPYASVYGKFTRPPAPGELVCGLPVLKTIQYGKFPCGMVIHVEGDDATEGSQ